MIYPITFACYGCYLHGDESGSELQRIEQSPYRMNRSRRETVLAALLERCAERHWSLLAAHVHTVIQAEIEPERIMNDLKSYASRCLNLLGADEPDRKRWARHGSTRWFWRPKSVSAAIRYVVDEQGEPMAVFEGLEP
jgi:hypothetical protein